MAAEDPSDRSRTPARPPLNAGHLLALADDHRRGLHATRAVEHCSRCTVQPLLTKEPDGDHVGERFEREADPDLVRSDHPRS